MLTYKEDFEKERADRERLFSEKNAMKVKYDNEISTLRIKLDRLQKELTHYTTANVKLEQQLKLRTSKDSDSYHTYLSTKVCECVSMCVPVCVHVSLCMYLCVYMCLCVCTCVCCMCVHACVCVPVYVPVCESVCAFVCVYVHIIICLSYTHTSIR